MSARKMTKKTTKDESEVIEGVIVNNDKVTKDPEINQDKFYKLLSDFDIDINATPEKQLKAAVADSNDLTYLAFRAGLRLIHTKQQCAHGEFEKLLEKANYTTQKASELMAMGRMITSATPKEINQIIKLPKTKLAGFARLEYSTLSETLADERAFSELSDMSVRDFNKRIKNLSTELDTRNKKIQQLSDQLQSKKIIDKDQPDYFDMIRQESNAAATKITLSCDDLQGLTDELEKAIQTGDPELAKFNALAAASLFTQSRAAAAHALRVFRTIETQFEHIVNLDDGLPADAVFTDAEIDQAIVTRSDLTVDHKQAQIIREHERLAKKPRKRGGQKKPKSL